MTLRTKPGSSLAATDEVVQRVEAMLRKNPYARDLFTTIGGGTQGRVTDAQIVVKLPEPNERPLTQAQIIDQVRADLKSVTDARISVEAVERMSVGGGRQGMLQLSVQGPKTASLDQLAGLTDRIVDGPEADAGHRRRRQHLRGRQSAGVGGHRPQAGGRPGVSAAQLGAAVRLLVGGDRVSRYQEGGEQYDVRVRLPETDRSDPAQIAQLTLRSRTGGPVQLSNLVKVVRDTGPTEIGHYAPAAAHHHQREPAGQASRDGHRGRQRHHRADRPAGGLQRGPPGHGRNDG